MSTQDCGGIITTASPGVYCSFVDYVAFSSTGAGSDMSSRQIPVLDKCPGYNLYIGG